MNKLVIGTRGSRLARFQSSLVATLIRRRFPELDIEEKIIVTEGDKLAGRLPSSKSDKGLFTRAIESELLDSTIDAAVHSYKDLPTDLPQGLCVGAVLERGPVEDALVTAVAKTIWDLPAGARVGTGGIRRAAQLRRLRPDLAAIGIQGNVDTRLKKLDAGDFDAVILASAGLGRLGLTDSISSIIDPSAWYHAVGQGALAVEIRRDDRAIADIVATLDHAATRLQTSAERAFLSGLGGGCLVPVGVRSVMKDDGLSLKGMVCGFDGDPFLEGEEFGYSCDAKNIGRKLAECLLQKGAGDVLASVRERQYG